MHLNPPTNKDHSVVKCGNLSIGITPSKHLQDYLFIYTSHTGMLGKIRYFSQYNLFVTQLFLVSPKGLFRKFIISISASEHTLVSTLKKLYYCLTKYLLKFRPQDFSQRLLTRHQYLFSTNTHFSTIYHSSIQGSIATLEKRLLEYSKTLGRWCFEKEFDPKTLGNVHVEHS